MSPLSLKAIRRMAFAAVLLASGFSQALAQTCRWDGTAPLCDGECSGDETEVARFSNAPGNWSPPFVARPDPFGSACLTGTKAFCCKIPGLACRWVGTAPFCDGECGNGEARGEPPPGSSSGASCWTGSKVYCCHRTSTGIVRSGLEANPHFTRYATIWEKGAGPAWQARHGLTSAQYQETFDALVRQGYRLVDVSGYSVGDRDTYAAIWEKPQGHQLAGGALTRRRSDLTGPPGPHGPDQVPWIARHAMTSDQYQQELDRLQGQGYRLVHINGHGVGGQALYAAIWEQRPGPAWIARHGLTAAQYQQEFDRLLGQGYRPVDISGYNVGGQDLYAAIWEQQPQSPPWVARHGLTSAQYQQEFNNLNNQGYRLTRISGWRSGDTLHYAAIWEKSEGPAWMARHGMSSDSYQEEFNKLTAEGYRLRHICGYHTYD